MAGQGDRRMTAQVERVGKRRDLSRPNACVRGSERTKWWRGLSNGRREQQVIAVVPPPAQASGPGLDVFHRAQIVNGGQLAAPLRADPGPWLDVIRSESRASAPLPPRHRKRREGERHDLDGFS